MSDDKQIAIPEEAFLLFDRADDEALIARIQGAALKEFVYSFRVSGQDIFGLSVDGYEACKRELAKTGEVIKEDTVEIEREDADTAYFRARASRWFVDVKTHKRLELDSSIGLKRQPKFTARKDGTLEPNSFWYETGGRKAIRNAGLSLIPEEIKQRILAAYKDQAKPVRMTPDVADKLTDEAHGLFDKREATQRAAYEKRIRKFTDAQIKVQLHRVLSLDPEMDWTKLDIAALEMLAKHLEPK